MRLCFFVLAALTMGWTAQVGAADLSRIDRSLKKEPAYKFKPKYCLLVLGPKAETRIWLVLDGEVLYVDRNGNGDLTEPGKRVTVATPNQDPASYEEVELIATDGTKHKFRFTLYGWFALRSGK